MRKNRFVTFLLVVLVIITSCASIPSTSKDRLLNLNGFTISESDYGGVERWYAVDKYNNDSLIDEVRFQVGYFKETNVGFILYGNETTGEKVEFRRQGLDLRWNWGNYERNGESFFRYSFVIQPDGTGLYFDFSTSTDGTANPKQSYKVKKF